MKDSLLKGIQIVKDKLPGMNLYEKVEAMEAIIKSYEIIDATILNWSKMETERSEKPKPTGFQQKKMNYTIEGNKK